MVSSMIVLAERSGWPALQLRTLLKMSSGEGAIVCLLCLRPYPDTPPPVYQQIIIFQWCDTAHDTNQG